MACSRTSLLAVCSALVLVALPAAAVKPPPCTGRFLAQQSESLVVGSSIVADTVLIEGTKPHFTATLPGTCPAVRAKVKATRLGTRVSATWKKNACGVPSKVKLKVTIPLGCSVLGGTVKTGKTPVGFAALVCGEGCVPSTTVTTATEPGATTTTLPDGVSFARNVYPILAANCISPGCHASQFPANGLDMSTAASAFAGLTTKTSAEAGCVGTKLVIPGSPAPSVIVKKLTGTSCGGSRMPSGKPPLATADIDTIRSWISEGAPDN